MSDGLVKILDGNTFVVSDERGDIEASLTDPTGLFSFDTRFLSRWVLTVNGERLNPLSVDDLEYFETRFFLVPGTGTVYIDAKLSVIRQRAVVGRLPRGADDPEPRRQGGVAHGADRRRLRLRGSLRGEGRAAQEGQVLGDRSERRKLTLGYDARDVRAGRPRSRRPSAPRSTRTASRSACASPRTASGRRRSTWSPSTSGAGTGAAHGARIRKRAQARMRRDLERWLGDAPRVECDWRLARGDVPAQPRRSRRAAVLAADRRRARAAGRRAAVVHDDVRPRQHLHEPAGAAVHARARRDDPPRARRLAGGARSTTSATRIPAGSSTRCATGR